MYSLKIYKEIITFGGKWACNLDCVIYIDAEMLCNVVCVLMTFKSVIVSCFYNNFDYLNCMLLKVYLLFLSCFDKKNV